MILRKKNIATEHAIDFIPILHLDYKYKVIFWTLSLTLVSRIHYGVVPIHLWCQITPGSSRFCIQVLKEMQVDCNHFCHWLFLSLWIDLLMTQCSILEKKLSLQEKVWYIGFSPVNFYLFFFFFLVGNFGGKISQQIKKIKQNVYYPQII